MIKEFQPVKEGVAFLVKEWLPILSSLSEDDITIKKNSQNRSVKQILGHLIDSVSNNTHRVIHLQYQESPISFPNYASNGNNDRWIAIQNYQGECWPNMLELWKHMNLHYIHIIDCIDPTKLNQQWYYSGGKLISLKEMVIDYLRHLELHINEIRKLMEQT